MRSYSIGMMAKSLAGHDQGKIYFVSGVDEEYVYLVDGKIRTLSRPKKKRKKHIQIDYRITEWIQKLLDQEKEIQDSDVIRAIKEYGMRRQEV